MDDAKHIDAGPATSRQFVAHPPFWGSKFASMTTPAWQQNPGRSYLTMVVAVLAFTAAIGALFVGVQSLAEDGSQWVQKATGYGFQYGLLLLLFGGVSGWTWWSRRRKVVISVTGDGLTVSTRPGDVYSLDEATLGTWGVTGGATMGTALHLHCGPRRFVLGGRDRRVAPGIRLEAPDAGYGQSIDVDAWLSAADFEEILTAVGRRTGLDARPPAAGGPTRCLLFTNALRAQEFGGFAFRKREQFMRSLSQPRLAVDVGSDAIRVVDPTTNALIASTSRAQVVATPVVFRPMQGQNWMPNPRKRDKRCSDRPLVHIAGDARVRSRYATTDHRVSRLQRSWAGLSILVAR